MNTFPCPSCQNPTSPDLVRCPVCGWVLHTHLPKGTKLQNGKYTVGKKLGQGGFGITYLGANTLLGMPVAIKELFLDGSGRGVTQQVIPQNPHLFQADKNRFLQEARTLGQFNHPNVVRILDFFEENNTCYLVMEHLNGQTLSERLQGGVLRDVEVDLLLQALLSGLEVVHTAGLLHRDIKPENIFLTHEGRVVLIDFGTARQFEVDKTSSHTRMVTPGYAPLEQYASSSRLSPGSDIYSLGATLYHCLTGEMPPAAPDRMSGEDLKLPVGSSGLMHLVDSCLKLPVKERPQSVQELRGMLGHARSADATFEPGLDFERLQRDAQRGDAEAQFRLAQIMESKPEEYPSLQAAGWYQKAAEQGHADAQYELALMYLYTKDIPRDVAQAEHWYQQAAHQGHLEALADLGRGHAYGNPFEKDVVKAEVILTRAAEQGHIESQKRLAFFYHHLKGGERNLHLEMYWLEKAAETGDAEAIADLAHDYYFEVEDHQQAAFWYQKGAELGDDWCQHMLGELYRDGEGVPQDSVKAFHWTQKSAQQGCIYAFANLAGLYREGIGVSRSDVQAAYWYKKSIEAGQHEGHFQLAEMYEQGKGGLPKSIPLAIEHYQQAVEHDFRNRFDAEMRLRRLL